MNDDPRSESELFVTDVVPNGGPETKAEVANTRIKARDLTDEHVGKYLGDSDEKQGINFPVKISLAVRLSPVSTGRLGAARGQVGFVAIKR